MASGFTDQTINTSGSSGDNDSMFGDCLKLPYYYGPIEDWMVATNVIHIAINIASALITIVANAVFLVTYVKTPSLRTPNNFFLILLAISDISVGLVSQPIFIALKVMEIHGIHDCVVWVAFQATVYYFSGISFLTVTLVSIERYLAVCRPITHRVHVTPKRMAIVALTVWVFWLPFPVMRFVFSEYFKAFGIFLVGMILLQFGANGCLYAKIYRRFLKSKLQNRTPHLRRVTHSTNLNKETHLAKTTACLLVVMILTYLPTIVGSLYKAQSVNTTYFFGFLPVAYTVVLLNSSFNPLFYCFKNIKIRKAICMLICGNKARIHCSAGALER